MVDPADHIPQGDPETVVWLPTGTLIGLHIRGLPGQHVMLGIREDPDGQPMNCAVVNTLWIEHRPLHSNPRRRPDHRNGKVG